MSITLKHLKSHFSLLLNVRPWTLDDVPKRLEMIKCNEIRTRVISFAMIFMGCINSQARLNPKNCDVGRTQRRAIEDEGSRERGIQKLIAKG